MEARLCASCLARVEKIVLKSSRKYGQKFPQLPRGIIVGYDHGHCEDTWLTALDLYARAMRFATGEASESDLDPDLCQEPHPSADTSSIYHRDRLRPLESEQPLDWHGEPSEMTRADIRSTLRATAQPWTR